MLTASPLHSTLLMMLSITDSYGIPIAFSTVMMLSITDAYSIPTAMRRNFSDAQRQWLVLHPYWAFSSTDAAQHH